MIEVKRAFVISDFAKNMDIVDAKKKVFSFSEKKIDSIISRKYKRRLVAYNAHDWFVATVSVDECGVWKRAGGLPLSWTNGNLADTARAVKTYTLSNFRRLDRRAITAIPGIIRNRSLIEQKEPYLLPIGFTAGTGTGVRKYLRKKVKVDIDDGCMRSIAMAVTGKKSIKMYLGFSKV